MRIGIAFDLKEDDVAQPPAPGLPDDWQEEFDSPETVAALAAALRAHGHEVLELGDGRGLVEKLLADPPDLVFNIAEGRGVSRSREARVPAVCEMLGVPYTGSDPGTLAAALDKDWARSLLIPTGIWQPWWRAEVDGADAEILEADVIFRAVVVPRGRHVVRFTFHPFSGALAELVGKMQGSPLSGR